MTDQAEADERRTDVEAFVDSARGALDAVWSSATAAAAPPADLWTLAVRQGWFELAEAEAPDFLVGLERVLGARACEIGVTDGYVAALLVPELAEGIAGGTVRPAVVWSIPAADRVLVAVPGASHCVLVDAAAATVTVRNVTRTEDVETLDAVPGRQLILGDDVTIRVVEGPVLAQALAVTRLAGAARLAAAARRAHELAVDHARTRRQFGRTIGAFGAVQQRIAACQIDVAACDALIDEAARSLVAQAPDAALSCALAARQVADVVIGVLAGAQHTLGAIGYFDEHEVFWLFRAVHAAVVRDRERERALPREFGIARALLGEPGRLPMLDLGPAAERMRAAVRSMLDSHRTATGFDAEAIRAEMAGRGWFAMSWPAADGGLAATLEEQVVLNEELKYAGGPVDRAMSATMLIGHSLLRHGTAEQKDTFLPLLRDGRMAFCLGYSEPEAGSDLASLRTTAVRDGDDWVINGQKLWTTRANTASHVWLAVRTDPDATPRHAGISILLVDMTTPGITIHEHRALSGEISCTVFYDDVRVPAGALVGEAGGGWKVITDALAAERVVMGGIAASLMGHFDALTRRLSARAPLDPRDEDDLEKVAARLQAARALVLRATRAMSGDEARILGPVAAVLSGDLAEEFGRVSLRLLGSAALVAGGEDGRFEAMLRLAPMYVIGGGTNDIQRGVIARSLGLARE